MYTYVQQSNLLGHNAQTCFPNRNWQSWQTFTWPTIKWKLFHISQRVSESYIYRFVSLTPKKDTNKTKLLKNTHIHRFCLLYSNAQISKQDYMTHFTWSCVMLFYQPIIFILLYSWHCFHFLQNNNITDVNKDTFCKSNDTYYLRLSLSEIRLDGNPVVLSKYPDSFTCMKVLPSGRYRWKGRNFTVASCWWSNFPTLQWISGALVPWWG